MAYALIRFTEAGETQATLCRTEHGQPTGADGVMDALSLFVEEASPTMLRQGSPGALRMAQLFMASERAAGREARLVGGEGSLGIGPAEVERLLEGPERGYLYELTVGRPGERSVPTVLMRPVRDGRPRRAGEEKPAEEGGAVSAPPPARGGGAP